MAAMPDHGCQTHWRFLLRAEYYVLVPQFLVAARHDTLSYFPCCPHLRHYCSGRYHCLLQQ